MEVMKTPIQSRKVMIMKTNMLHFVQHVFFFDEQHSPISPILHVTS